MHPEQRQARIKKARESRSPELLKDIGRKLAAVSNASRTPEERSALARRANAAGLAFRLARTPEQRREAVKAANAARRATSPERRIEIANKVSAAKKAASAARRALQDAVGACGTVYSPSQTS